MQRNQVMTQASVNDLKRGYVFAAAQDRFHCLCCGFKTEPGQIYRAADAYYDAEKFIRIHIETEQKILATYFPQGIEGPLATYPGREKRRLIVLRQLAERFSPDRAYDEKEVNAVLSAAYEDHVLLRRHLIDYGFFSRRPDGSEYRRNDATALAPQNNTEEADTMDSERKKALLREYKETPLPIGVFQIKNNVTGKLLLLKALNLPGIINRHQLELRRGMHRNSQLQADWNQYGETAFSFDVLATLKPEEYLPEYYPTAVNDLFEAWLEKLQPFGDSGYNKPK